MRDMIVEKPFPGVRFMGVLQRISLCYLVVTINYMIFERFYFHLIFIGSCVIVYLSFMYGFNVPDFEGQPCGRGNTSPECNFGSYLD